MSSKYTSSGKALSIPAGLGISMAISLGMTMIFSAFIANLLNTQSITWSQAGYWIMGMLFLGSFLGAKAAITTIRRQQFAVSMMAGCLYWGILLCITALFFGGNYSSIWETALLILGGSGTATILTFPKRSKNKKKRSISSR